jgi:hypothetical protein
MLCVEEGGQLLRLWAKGNRRRDGVYTVTVQDVYLMAARLKAAEIKRRKAEERAARRKAQATRR